MEEDELLHLLKNVLYGLVLLILSSVSSAANAANSGTYKDTINKNQQIVEAQRSRYRPLVEKNQEQISKLEPEHKRIIKQAEQAYKEHANNIDVKEGSILEEVVENIKNLDAQVNNSKNKGIIVFISFSMPQSLLWSYQEQARLYGARLVIRGLVDNSFKKTIQAVDLGNGRIMKLDVNPMLFKDYGITKVPSIVIAGEPTSNKLEDKFIGTISLKHALEESSIHGDQREFSLAKLKQLSTRVK